MPIEFWECLKCAYKCDLRQDDYCPTCGAELPLFSDPEIEGLIYEAMRQMSWFVPQTADG